MWMKLREYLRQHGIRPEDFAKRLKVSKSAVAMWSRGDRMPRLAALQKITKATDGAVTANDFAEAA